MTFREKLEKERPNNVDESFLGGCISCPDSYGYTNDKGLCGGNILGKSSEELCRKCWDREIPEEKEKENKPMKKTKAMLEEELEQKKSEIDELKKELEKAEKYKQYEDAAGELKAAYDSFVNAGFDEGQAFVLITIMLQNQKAAPTYTWESYLSKYLDARKKERRNV